MICYTVVIHRYKGDNIVITLVLGSALDSCNNYDTIQVYGV